MKKEEKKTEISDRKQTKPWLFKKGVSGNPKGKPKGTLSITTLVRNALMKIAKESPDKSTYEQLFIKRIMQKAIVEGDNHMIKLIWEQIDGSAAQKVDVTSGGEPIQGFNYVSPKSDE